MPQRFPVNKQTNPTTTKTAKTCKMNFLFGISNRVHHFKNYAHTCTWSCISKIGVEKAASQKKDRKLKSVSTHKGCSGGRKCWPPRPAQGCTPGRSPSCRGAESSGTGTEYCGLKHHHTDLFGVSARLPGTWEANFKFGCSVSFI